VPWSLDQWLAYQTQVHPQTIDLGLDRLGAVLERLQWRQPVVPVITVAGTNGKGSVSAYCAAILGAAGHRVGTFTSPHLRDYRERIRIHDRLVGADDLVSAFERIEAARGAVALTFFEFNTLAALLVFEAARLDAWVLEVGMGGRLDAVNVVDADVAVLVSIGFDHQEYLGTTLDAIAREKAGIFRKDRPAVLGAGEMPAIVEDHARIVGAPLKRLGVEFTCTAQAQSADWHYRGPHWDLPRLPPPALQGDTQVANAAIAIAALEEIAFAERAAVRRTISAAAVAQGLRQVSLAARFQVIAPQGAAGVNQGASEPTWILDVAHNPAAARVLAANLRASRGAGRTFAVCGILADKDAAGITAALADCVDAWWCTSTDGARGQSGALLAMKVRAVVMTPVLVEERLEEACAAAMERAQAGDRIVVFGSFHTVGPAIDWLEAQRLLPSAAP
jgi:dihydrofolate synthase/folylpolyglutamate synthase